MKKIELLHLDIENFKGVDNVSIDFNDTITNVLGRNGSGKSSIYSTKMVQVKASLTSVD